MGENISKITNIIMDYLDDDNQSALMFLADFEKAFDTVEHSPLWSALEELGFGILEVRQARSIGKDS